MADRPVRPRLDGSVSQRIGTGFTLASLTPAMAVRARDNVPLLAAVLSAVSLALVFGAVFGAIPTTVLPRMPGVLAIIPGVNAAISVVAIAAIGIGWGSIRRGDVDRHRAAMIAATVLFAAFLLLYLYRVALEGPAPFPGPDLVYRFLYLPLLLVHVTLAVVCVPLLNYVLLIGVTHPIAEIPGSRHPAVGRIAAALWTTSFVLGIAVYLLLYQVY